jgi:hypothetical protein
MDETAKQETGEARARVHDFDPQREERKTNGGSRGNDQARIFEEPRQQGRRAAEDFSGRAEKMGNRGSGIAEEAASGLHAINRMWADSSSMSFGTAANFMLSWQRELADFFSKRIEKDVQFGRRLIDARDPMTLMRLNAEFARETLSDYATCTAEIATRAVSDAQQRGCQIVERAEETVDDLRQRAQRTTSHI